MTRPGLALLSLTLGLTLCACDAGKKPPPDTTADTVSDTSADVAEVASDTELDAVADSNMPEDVPLPDAADTAVEVEVVPDDPCDPDPCGVAPATHCALHLEGHVSYGVTCTAKDGAAECTYPETLTACPVDELCVAGVCTSVPTRCDFPFGTRLGVTTALVPGNQSSVIVTETGEPEDACCEDWDNDGFIDNGFGDTSRTLAPFIGSAADVWAASLSRNRPVIDLQGLDDVANDPEVWLYAYGGQQYDAAAGAITLVTAAFDPVRNIPLAAGRGYVEDGILHITDGYQRVSFGDRDAPLYVETTHWHVDGRLVPATEGGGVGLAAVGSERGARMSGLASHIAMLTAFNIHATEFCNCTDFAHPDEPVIDLALGESTCRPLEERSPRAGCTETEAFCKVLTGMLCDAVVGQFQPDVDTNGDAKPDMMSTGWWTTLAPVARRDVAQCPSR